MEITYIAEVVSSNTSNPYLLPLADSFNFNLSFLILPDIIFNNIPITVRITKCTAPLNVRFFTPLKI